MDDNIGRRLNALVDILTTMTGAEGEHLTYSASAGGGLSGSGAGGLGGESDAADEPLSSATHRPQFSINEEAENVFLPSASSRIKPQEQPPFSAECVK